MALDRDTVLLETVRTHRARLQSAFLYGELAERRPVIDNVKRAIASIVLAAVVCVGCIGYAVVTGLIAQQAAQRHQQQGPAAITGTPTSGTTTTGALAPGGPQSGIAQSPTTPGASR